MPRLAGSLGEEFVFHGYTLRPPDSSGGFFLANRIKEKKEIKRGVLTKQNSSPISKYLVAGVDNSCLAVAPPAKESCCKLKLAEFNTTQLTAKG